MGGRRTVIAALVAVLTPVAASAGESDARAYVPPPAPYDWTVTIGVEGRDEPLFQGSSLQRLRPYPIVAVRRYGTPEPFRGPRDGLDIALIDGGYYQAGPVGQLVWSQRGKASSPGVQRLGNVPWAGEVGIFAQYWWVPWLRTRAEVRQGFNGHEGIVSDIMVDAVVPVSPQWTLSGGPRVTLATAPRHSRLRRGCRYSTPKAECGHSEPARRRATSGRRSGRRTPSSSTNGSPAMPEAHRW